MSELSEPDPERERDSGLLIRVWTEPGAPDLVRARMLSFHGGEEPVSWSTAAGEAAIVRALEEWLRSRVPSTVADPAGGAGP